MSKERYHHHIIASRKGLEDEEERQRVIDDLEFDLDTELEMRRALEQGEDKDSEESKRRLWEVKNRIGDLEQSIRNLKQDPS